MNNKLRTPTQKMIEKLRRCGELQMNNLPCTEGDLKGSLSGLYKRGYVDTTTHFVNGKKLIGLIVTDKGFEFLKKIQSASQSNNQ